MPASSTNGIKEMSGFRQTFSISYSQSDHINQTAPCVSVDDVETSALLVCKCHDHDFFISLPCALISMVYHIPSTLIFLFTGCYCVNILHWCSGRCPSVGAALRLGWEEGDPDRRGFTLCTRRSSADILILPLVPLLRLIYSSYIYLGCIGMPYL